MSLVLAFVKSTRSKQAKCRVATRFRSKCCRAASVRRQRRLLRQRHRQHLNRSVFNHHTIRFNHSFLCFYTKKLFKMSNYFLSFSLIMLFVLFSLFLSLS